MGNGDGTLKFHNTITKRQPVNFKSDRFGVDENKEHLTQGLNKA